MGAIVARNAPVVLCDSGQGTGDGVYGFGTGLHSMCVLLGSMGNAQKKPFSCIAVNNSLEVIRSFFFGCQKFYEVSTRRSI